MKNIKNKYKFHKTVVDLGYAFTILPLIVTRVTGNKDFKWMVANLILLAVVCVIIIINMLAANKYAAEQDKKYHIGQICFMIFCILGALIVIWVNYKIMLKIQ